MIDKEQQTANIDTLWEIFKADLQSAVKEFVPHRKSSARDRPPWITPQVKKLLRARNRLFKKHQKRPNESCAAKLKSLKKKIQKSTKEAYWSYTESLITEDNTSSGTKRLWTFIKHKKTDSIDVAPLKQNNILKDLPKDKAEILNNQFSSVFTSDCPEDYPDDTAWASENQYPLIPDVKVAVEGVHKLFKRLKPK